jgi:hypothetical protein
MNPIAPKSITTESKKSILKIVEIMAKHLKNSEKQNNEVKAQEQIYKNMINTINKSH